VIGMLDPNASESAADGHDFDHEGSPGGALPDAPLIPYRSELLGIIADWVHQWNSPEFSIDVVAGVDPRLSVSGSRVLTRLYAAGLARPSDLAAQLHTGASNISKLLAQLEGMEFVERRPDTDDARVVRVQLTDAGRKAAEGVIAGADEAMAYMVRDWTEDEVRSYSAQTRRLIAAGRDYVHMLGSGSSEA
jgi:DNA-binding MarR family transcriptional regulator